MRVNRVYYVKAGSNWRRLRCQIGRYRYHVGQQVRGTTLYIAEIWVTGLVVFHDSAAGVKFDRHAERWPGSLEQRIEANKTTIFR